MPVTAGAPPSLRVILGVTGGIAAYKAPMISRLLTEAGHRVRIVPTRNALRMVGAATFATLTHEPVHTEVFDDPQGVEHVALGREADLVIVAPATAQTIARMAAGMADDLLTATLLTARCPLLVAPAMHTEMWEHPATQANVATLRSRGVTVMDPDEGRLTGADTGKGRLPEPDRIVAAALALVEVGSSPEREGCENVDPESAGPQRDWAGLRLAVSAGGTREPLDPVRFLGNRSSGRQGVAIATAAARRGAQVVLASANIGGDVLAALPESVRVVPVGTALELRELMLELAQEADVIVMAAAVADFRPVSASEAKIKKAAGGGPAPIELVENPDILAELARDARPGQVVVGFAAETGDDSGSVMEHGRAKALRKGADFLAVNKVGEATGFGDVPNSVTVLDRDGEVVGSVAGSKDDVAQGLLSLVRPLKC